MRKTIIRLVLFSLGLILSMHPAKAAATKISCSEVNLGVSEFTGLKKSKVDDIMLIIFYKKDRPKEAVLSFNEPNVYFDLILNSKKFAAFLVASKLTVSPNSTILEKYVLVRKYLESFFAQYNSDSKLESYKEKVMNRALKLHGIEPLVGETARQTLQRVSNENVDRILAKLEKYESTPALSAMERLVENLELTLTHNSHYITGPLERPLLSPKKLEKMGLKDFGLSSSFAFNRFLESDQHIYFWPKFRRKGSLENPQSNYGKTAVSLERDYALANAWISSFIMYPWELVNSVMGLNPTIAKELAAKSNEMNNVRLVGPEKEIRAAQAELGNLDFTVKDYDFLIKTILMRALAKMHRTTPTIYYNLMEKLNSGSFKEINESINNLLGLQGAPFTNSSGFEAKVPVSIPSEKLRSFTEP